MKYIFTLILVTLASSVLAVGERGNGGYSVVCRNSNNEITSAEVLDIYEGRLIYKKNYSDNKSSVDELIAFGKTRLEEKAYFLTMVNRRLEIIYKNLVFIPAGNELQETDDAFPPVKKTGCNFEQLANYTEGGEIIISQEIWDHLDNLNKAALFLHESIYYLRRKAVQDKTSEVTRRIVSQIMAANPDPSVIDRWTTDTFYRMNNTRPCGLTGTLEERMEECSYVKAPAYNFILVARTSDGKEVWMDPAKKVVWSDTLSYKMNYESAVEACESNQTEKADLDLHWRLPTSDDYSNGQPLTYALPNMTHFSEIYWFWTSTTRGRSVMTFNGGTGELSSTFFRSTAGSVRCIAKAQ